MTTREEASAYLRMQGSRTVVQPVPAGHGASPHSRVVSPITMTAPLFYGDTPRSSASPGAPSREQPRARGFGTWPLVGLLVTAVTLSLLAGAMMIGIRSAEELAHHLNIVRFWAVDAYSCAIVSGLACLTWVAFFAAAARLIVANKGPKSDRRHAP